MDFPQNPVLPIFVNTWGSKSPMIDSRGILGFVSATSLNWPSANLAIYVPMWLPYSYPVKRLFWANGSAVSGSVDIGLYTKDGAKIYSSGPTVQSGNSALQYVTPTTDLMLSAGTFYIGISCSGTTNSIIGASIITATEGRLLGLLQQASASTLPNTATFAQWTSTGYPLCGFTRTTTGF